LFRCTILLFWSWWCKEIHAKTLCIGICDTVHIEYHVSLQLNCLIWYCITIPNTNSMKLIMIIDYNNWLHIFTSTTCTYQSLLITNTAPIIKCFKYFSQLIQFHKIYQFFMALSNTSSDIFFYTHDIKHTSLISILAWCSIVLSYCIDMSPYQYVLQFPNHALYNNVYVCKHLFCVTCSEAVTIYQHLEVKENKWRIKGKTMVQWINFLLYNF